MVNNIGITIEKLLNSKLGGVTTPALVSTDIEMKSGTLGNGCLIFDANGTIGIVSDYEDENTFVVKTYAVSIDLQKILSLSY